jgi:uncharacterized protein (TIGR00251 family)
MNDALDGIVDESGGGVVISVHVQPRASRSMVKGLHGGELKVTLTAPPVNNAANEALVRLVADLFSVPKSSVSIQAGHSSRHKKVAVSGVSAAAVEAALHKAVS